MTSWSQWWVGFQKTKAVRQVTWVCGPERILVDEIIRAVSISLQAAPWNRSTLFAGEVTDRTIWTEVNQLPMDGEARLVTIRNAEKISDFDPLLDFIRNRSKNPRTHLLFVSNDETLPRHAPTPEEERLRKTPEVLDYIAAFSGKGHVIECKPFTTSTAKHAIAWVQSKVSMRTNVAAHLLTRAAGDMRLARDICTKLAVFDGEATIATINAMLSERPGETFSDSLLALDRKGALLALEHIRPDEYSRTLGHLDARLDLAGQVHDLLLEHKTPFEISRAVGRQSWLVPQILPVAKHYDSKRRLQIRKVLAMADETLRSGETVGVFEAVVAFW